MSVLFGVSIKCSGQTVPLEIVVCFVTFEVKIEYRPT